MNAVAYEDCARGATSGQYTTLVLMHQATLNAVAYEDCARGATSGQYTTLVLMHQATCLWYNEPNDEPIDRHAGREAL